MLGNGSHRSRRIQSEMHLSSSSSSSSSRNSGRGFWDVVMIRDDQVQRCRWANCGQTFPNSAALKHHHDTVHRSISRPFQCQLCTQDFTQRQHLNQHIMTVHKRLKPHACDKCSRRFGKRFDLMSHQAAVHNNERPHVCPVCRSAFAKKSNLARHEKTLHREFYTAMRARQAS